MLSLPPLNALRAFEAAARTGSFAAAAAELHVTPAAISHHVRELESVLALRLFDRHAQRVAITPAGEQYRLRIGAALRAMEEATARLRRAEIDGPLRLSLPQSTAQWWLAPRLSRLVAEFPAMQLQVVGDSRRVDLRKGEADVALRFGAGDYPGLHSRLVIGDAISVLDAAANASDAPLRLLEDLGASPAEPWLHWAPWLRELGRASDRAPARIGFSDSGLALTACLAGAGWCIGRISLAFDPLQRGQLKPLAAWRPSEFGHYLVCRPEDADSQRVAAFGDWLSGAARQFAAAVRASTGLQLALPPA